LVRSRPFAAEIRAGDRSWTVHTIQVAVGNGRHYGGGLTVDESAQIDDGLLHLYSLEVDHWWRGVLLLPALWRGTLGGTRYARVLTGPEFEVRPAKRPRHVSTDGEIATRTPATFRVTPRALAVFAP